MTRTINVVRSIAKPLLLPLAALMLSTSIAHAQERVKFSSANITVREALGAIKTHTGYGIAYNGLSFDAGRTITLSSTELTWEEAMRQIVTDAGFSYSLSHGVIAIRGVGNQSIPAKTNRAMTDDVYHPNKLSDLSTRPLRKAAPRENAPVTDTAAMYKMEISSPEPFSRHFYVGLYAENQGAHPRWAFKTNLLYGFGTLTPNLAVEIGLSSRVSLELSGSYNPWNLSGSLESNRKLVHMIIRPELRFWICERYNGHFIGADAIFGRYNIGSRKLPMLFNKESRYDGISVGAGGAYGYHLMRGRRWGAEFTVGAGLLWLKYDRYDCASCDRNGVKGNKIYLGPTHAGINLVFLLK